VRCSGAGDETGTERETSEHLGFAGENIKDNFVGNRKHLGIVKLALVKVVLDVHLVLEGTDLQFVQKSGLTSSDLVINLDDNDGVNNFDLTLDNLGLDVQSLEERSLFRVKTGGTSGDSHLSRGN